MDVVWGFFRGDELRIISGKDGTCFRVELACTRPRGRLHLVGTSAPT